MEHFLCISFEDPRRSPTSDGEDSAQVSHRRPAQVSHFVLKMEDDPRRSPTSELVQCWLLGPPNAIGTDDIICSRRRGRGDLLKQLCQVIVIFYFSTGQFVCMFLDGPFS